MEVGDLVKVRTKHYGEKIGVIIKCGFGDYFIQPANHPRMIIASVEDMELISKLLGGYEA